MQPPANTHFSYRRLDADEIVRTIDTLVRRIDERFPDASLAKVGRQLHEIALQAKARSAWIGRPIWSLRIFMVLLVVGVIAALVAAGLELRVPNEPLSVPDFVQILDSGMNDLVLVGAAVFFLFTVETRIKRRRALAAIDELRAISHIIDMHQLTKDPEVTGAPERRTAASPKRCMNRFELSRYLDYCGEMLALAGKVAALYVQHFDDAVALASANEVETLSTGLARKIWQKLIILHSMPEGTTPHGTPLTPVSR